MSSGSIKRAALLIAAAALCTGTAGAAEGGFGLEALMRSMAEVKSAKGTFVEQKHLRILSAPLELSGTLSYTAPGRLEKRTLAPEPAAMVVDGERLVIEDGKTGERRTLTLRDHPAVWAFVESIRATLSGDLTLLRRFYEVALEGGSRDWRLVLTPRGAEMRELVKEIRVSGSGNRVTAVEVLETGGDRSVMTITGAPS